MKNHTKKQSIAFKGIVAATISLASAAAYAGGVEIFDRMTEVGVSPKYTSLISQTQTIRSQLELYQVQHDGIYPPADQLWQVLTSESETDGSLGDGSGDELGPYLQQPPVNSFANSTTVGHPGPGVGWTYDSQSGSIFAVMNRDKAKPLFKQGMSFGYVLIYETK